MSIRSSLKACKLALLNRPGVTLEYSLAATTICAGYALFNAFTPMIESPLYRIPIYAGCVGAFYIATQADDIIQISQHIFNKHRDDKPSP